MGGLTFLVGKNQPPLFSSNAKKNRSSNGVVVKAYSTLDAAQAVLGCILQGSQHSFHRTAQMKLEAVMVYPGGNPGIIRRELNPVAIPTELDSWPIPISMGDGLVMYISEDPQVSPENYNELASRLLLITRGVDYAVYGKVIFLSVENGKEQNAPKWVETVLRNSEHVKIVFAP